MKKHNLLIATLLGTFIVACNHDKEDNFSINESLIKAQYTNNESVSLQILNPKTEKIDSTVYTIDGKRIGSGKGNDKFNFGLKNSKLGYQDIKATTYFDGKTEVDSTRLEVISAIKPKMLSYTIVNTYPHDIHSFTEGLEFYKDTLYESAGQYGESRLLKVDYKTGKVLKSLNLEGKYFGEGLTIINGKIFQLTYREKVGFIYDVNTWKLEKTFTFDKPEGWGMTNDGKNIYFNDSTEKVWTMSPETQKTTDYINVYSTDSKIKEINELEWVDGKIYSNIWQRDFIIKIDPKTGSVEGILDLSALKNKITKLPDNDVLNGIAYNPKTKTFFVTGKNWDKMFEIRIKE